jgi:TIR domain
VSHHFFLSYSRADQSPLVTRFFEDLSDTIRIESGLLRTEQVGFCEEIPSGPASEWSDAAREALQNSGMMVCLLSPAYLHCERAGKEWQVFEMRRRSVVPQESLAHVILPVTWSQWHGPLPKVINEMLAHPDHINQRQALATMFRSSGMFNGDYAEFVKTLANQIIELTPAASKLRPLDPLPKMSEVPSAFHLWDEAAAGSEASPNQSKRSEDAHSNAEYVPPQPAVTVSAPWRASSSNPQQPPTSTTGRKPRTGEYLVFAISKEKEILDRISQCCHSSAFNLNKYEIADKARQKIVTLSDDGKELPDLLIIDRDIEQVEFESTKKLSEKMRLPSEILFLSGSFEQGSLKQFGGHTILQKSDLEDELFDLMNRCAQIGRDRSNFRTNRALDPARSKRPVFLSYSHKDRIPATFLLRNFEARGIWAWSMDETLKPGDDSYSEIVKGIDDARILVSLITEDYLASPFCKGELFSFYTRVKRAQCEEDRPHLISVLYDKPDITEFDFIIKPYQYIEMSDSEYLIPLQILIRRINNLINFKF